MPETAVSLGAGAKKGDSVRFESEAQLVDLLHPGLSSAFSLGGRATETFFETKVGSLVADVVFMTMRSGRRVSSLRPFSAFESVVLATLRRVGATRIDLLEKAMQRPSGSLRRGVLDELEKAEVVRRERGGRISLGPNWPPDLELVAVEAKLKRWRDALVQAASYSCFADRVLVALPKPYAQLAYKNMSQFVDRGVGLVSVSHSELCVLYDGERKATHDWKRDFLISRLLART